MIVKILSSASNFAGIHYNERKNDAGKSELLSAQNFGSLSLNSNPSKADYINYMTSFCNTNQKVKKVQFHAVISDKGKETSLEKLKDIGVQFLKAMGYAYNPFLIYHHADTSHNHIHLVSTRVDPHGKKVDDRFEKLRSQKVMHEILMRDPHFEADQCLKEAMKYNFSTMAQFKLLLELKGFKVQETLNGLSMSKYGSMIKPLDTGAIEGRISGFALLRTRAAQLKAIFSKYALGTIDEQWCSFMKEKFGLDIVFHQKQGHDRPYGYTVIDHPSKYVFKGAQILRLAELLALPQEKKVNELVHELAQQPAIAFSDLSTALSKLGVNVHQNASYFSKAGQGKLSIELINKLRYAERLKTASGFLINDPSCKIVLGKLLRVNPTEINFMTRSREHFLALGATLLYLDQSKRWNEGIKHYNFQLLQIEKYTFLFSPREPALIRLDKLFGGHPSHLPANIPLVHEINELERNHELSTSHILDALFSVLAASQQGPKEDRKNKRSSIKL